jgi:class 3 adenylate cyclase
VAGSSPFLNAEPAKRTRETFRLDLVSQVASVDEETRIVRMAMTPDPRRYEPLDREGGTWFLDKYFHTIVRLEDFAEAPMAGLPFYASGRTLDSATEYAAERLTAVEHELETGQYTAPSQKARLHAQLSSTSNERDIAFISLDVCGSTAYQKRDPNGFDTAFRFMLQELGATVGQFQGSILKTTGDGFIAFLDFPGFCVQVDSTVDLCGSMLEVLHSAVNPAIVRAGLEPLSVRIGADYGPALVRELSVPTTGFATAEVTSDALNRSVKIEQTCDPNTIRLGFDLYRLSHVQWLERCHEVEFDGTQVGIPDYQVFELR